MAVIVSKQLKVPSLGKRASDYAVGESVFLLENGAAVEYLVVHQGLPGSMYDASCDGTWLLRKDIRENRQWHSSDVNDYANSTIHAYLNSTFLSLFDADTQAVIKQVKIPYRPGAGYSTNVNSGANGLPAKIFLLSGTEVNIGSGGPTNEGACLARFYGTEPDGAEARRIGYRNGTWAHWWTRTPLCSSAYGATHVSVVNVDGGGTFHACSYSLCFRPALVIDSNTLFDPDTNTLKEAA